MAQSGRVVGVGTPTWDSNSTLHCSRPPDPVGSTGMSVVAGPEGARIGPWSSGQTNVVGAPVSRRTPVLGQIDAGSGGVDAEPDPIAGSVTAASAGVVA